MKKSETKKYIAVIDPKAGIAQGFAYKALNAKNLIDAMREASNLMNDSVYLIDLYEKLPGGDKEKVFYNPVLRNRGYGWNDVERDTNILDTLAFYYKYHEAGKEIKTFDVEWVAYEA